MLLVYKLIISQQHIIGTYRLHSPCPLPTPTYHDHRGLVEMACAPVAGNIVMVSFLATQQVLSGRYKP